MTFWQFAFKNVSRNSKAYFAYFVSSAFSIMVFFFIYCIRVSSALQSFQEHFSLNVRSVIRDTHYSWYLTETIKKIVIYRKHDNWDIVYLYRHSRWTCIF